jgi:hypothetical protein
LENEAEKWMNLDFLPMNTPWDNVNLQWNHAIRLRFLTVGRPDYLPDGTGADGGPAGLMASSTSFKAIFDKPGFKASKRSMPAGTPLAAARR